MALVLALAFVFLVGLSQADGQLMVGFYGETCPEAESIVRTVVRDAFLSDANTAAVLLRLHFHDCFVQVIHPSLTIS